MKNTLPKLPKPIHKFLAQICTQMRDFPWVEKIVLYGSYAKGGYAADSDLDLAVFAKNKTACDLPKYRQLARICRTDMIDVQVQVFSVEEMEDPCGIVEEIMEFGIEITDLQSNV